MLTTILGFLLFDYKKRTKTLTLVFD